MTATYFIAEHYFSLTSLFNHVHEYLKEYRSDKTPSFEIVITKEDIIEETKYDELLDKNGYFTKLFLAFGFSSPIYCPAEAP